MDDVANQVFAEPRNQRPGIMKPYNNILVTASLLDPADNGIDPTRPGAVRAIVRSEHAQTTKPRENNLTGKDLETLYDSEIRYRRLFESAKDGILILDAETVMIEEVNPFLIHLLGLSHDGFLGKKLWELGSFKNIVANKIKFSELQTRKYVRYDDLPLETVDGRQIAVEFVSNVYFENKKSVIQCNIRDISERKSGEEALHKSEARIHALFENMVEGFAYCRMLFEDGRPKDFVYLEVNNAFHTLTGLTDVVGRRASEVIPGIHESDPDLLDHYARVALTGEPDHFEIYLVAMDMWLSVSVYCPEKEHFVVVFEVITERKLVETRMQLQSSALEAAANAIVITDDKCEIQWVNTAFTTHTGYSSAEAIGQSASLLKSDKQDEEFYKNMWMTISAGDVWQGELINRRKDGSLYTEGMTITPLKIDGDEITHYVAVKEDITDRKRMEATLLRTQRMESIGTLAGGIAHDLNNVLAPILMAVEILGQKITDDADREILATLETSALHGAQLVKQVLGFARGIEGQRISVDVVNILEHLQNIIRDTFPKNIHFSLNSGRDSWKVTGDPTQLQQVLTNLCVNARDAMPDGGKLSVTLENAEIDEIYAGMNPDSQPGAYVMVKIADTGTGIPPKTLERIFEPFFTTKEIGKGTGMGLSTTLAIVRSHGGFITVYSETGKGTTFKIYLPACVAPRESGAGEIKQAELPRGNGELVLLVDDADQIRAIAQYTLERFGYRVLPAANGAEAVAAYAEHRQKIAIVLTDMAMPVMDGAATLAALKVMNPHVKAIASSGLTSNGQNTQASRAGFKHFIAKPYTAEAILKVLAEALRDEP